MGAEEIMNGEIFTGIFIFLLGMVMGSFFNVCIYRLPKNQSVVNPPSHCCACGHKLSFWDMVPVLSFVLLGGRCRYCNARITPRYALVELLTGLLFLMTYFLTGASLELVFYLIFVSIMVIITFIDIDHRIIMDRFAIIGFLLAPAYLFAALIPSSAFSHSLFYGFSGVNSVSDLPIRSALLGGLIGACSLLAVDLLGRAIYKKESMGFGDVKLMAWAGIFLGVKGVIVALIFALWVAAVAGLILLRVRKRSGNQDHQMPFGPFLAAGSVFAIFFAGRVVSWYLSYL